MRGAAGMRARKIGMRIEQPLPANITHLPGFRLLTLRTSITFDWRRTTCLAIAHEMDIPSGNISLVRIFTRNKSPGMEVATQRSAIADPPHSSDLRQYLNWPEGFRRDNARVLGNYGFLNDISCWRTSRNEGHVRHGVRETSCESTGPAGPKTSHPKRITERKFEELCKLFPMRWLACR